MRDDLHRDVLDQLRSFDFKERGEYLREGRCPKCAKKSLWVRKDRLWILRCERLNKCSYEGHVKELFPELFENWSERYKSSDENPTAAADAYLSHARGLRLIGLRGAYTQDEFWSREKREGSATVRFPIRSVDEVPVTWWERLIDRPWRFGDMKARFQPGTTYKGLWWTHPECGLDVIAAADDLWLVEGIFDTSSLHEAGLATAATLSCNNYPEHRLAQLRQYVADRRIAGEPANEPRLVFAYDSDSAGKRYIRDFVKRATAEGWKATAAQIQQPARGKLDWNDLHTRAKDGEWKAHAFGDFLWRGALLLAKDAKEKAFLLHQRSNRATFPFDYDNRLYWGRIDPSALAQTKEELRQAGGWDSLEALEEAAIKKVLSVSQIANCHPRPLYFQRDSLTDESWYFYRVDFPHHGPVAKNTFTPAQIAGAAEFKKRLLAIAPFANFTGNTAQLDRLHELQRERLRIVEALGFVGYAREHGAYVFNDLAVKDGKTIALNDDDFFDLGPVSVKSTDRSVGLEITPWTDAPIDWPVSFIDDLWNAFHAKGLIALAYWFLSLYAEQIRARHKSLHFLELAGEKDTGKSTLIEFLWKLCGRVGYEGFDPSKATVSGRTRTFAQVGNLPIVLMEGDRDEETAKGKKFDFDELKSLYNGRSVRTRGAKTGGNETYEPPFRGSIVIEQNRPVDASPAILSRICHVWFDGEGYNASTKAAADRLEAWSVDDLSGFIIAAARAEKQVLDRICEVFPRYEKGLMAHPQVSDRRIAKCHAQLLAALEALTLLLPIDDDRMAVAQSQIQLMAMARKQAIGGDAPIVEAFWDAYDFIASRKMKDVGTLEVAALNHTKDEQYIAVNLNEFASIAGELRLPIPELAALKANLRSSKTRKFIAVRDVRSCHINKTLHCWVFAASASSRNTSAHIGASE